MLKKNIIFKEVIYQDFKGIKRFETPWQIGRNKVSGFNGSGKTTLAESLIFALTGKGLFDEKIKNEPIKNGVIKDDYNQEITLTFMVDNVEYKVYKNIVKNSVKEMSINRKPYKVLKGFNAEIEQILGIKMEEIPLLSNPKYFNSLPNKDARKAIISYVEKDISEADYVDDLNMKENIKNGIDLTTQFELREQEVKNFKKKLEDIDLQIKTKQESRENISNVDFKENDELIQEKEQVEKELAELKNEYLKNHNLRRKEQDIRIEIKNKQNELISLDQNLHSKIKENEDKLEKLRKDYDELNLKPVDSKCFACGSINEFSKQEAENNKQKQLDKLEVEALELKQFIDNQKLKVKKLAEKNKSIQKEIEVLKLKLDSISFKEFDNEKLVQKEQELKNIIEALGSYNAIKIIDNEIQTLKTKRESIKKDFDIVNEKLLILIEALKNKSTTIENQINSELDSIRIKLFEQKKNGNIKNIFTITNLDGIDYSRLNNAAQINSGIELINFIQKHKGIQFPIIIDNAESINKLFETKSQTIELIVSDREMEIK